MRTLLQAWDSILAATAPDLVVADYAPAASMIARGRIPLIVAGNGFTAPPGDMKRFPPLHRVTAPRWNEDDTLRAVNRALRFLDRPALEYLPQIFAGDAQIALFEGARELLADLRQAGATLAIATGKTRAGLDRALSHHGDVSAHFAATRCADEGRPKPHADMVLHLMDRVAAGPHETVMVGDTTHDLALARNAGVASIGVSYGAHDAAGFGAYAPVGVAGSIREMRELLLY